MKAKKSILYLSVLLFSISLASCGSQKQSNKNFYSYHSPTSILEIYVIPKRLQAAGFST